MNCAVSFVLVEYGTSYKSCLFQIPAFFFLFFVRCILVCHFLYLICLSGIDCLCVALFTCYLEFIFEKKIIYFVNLVLNNVTRLCISVFLCIILYYFRCYFFIEILFHNLVYFPSLEIVLVEKTDR